MKYMGALFGVGGRVYKYWEGGHRKVDYVN